MGVEFWTTVALVATGALVSATPATTAVPSIGTSLSYLSGPVLMGDTYTWSKVITPVTVGTVLITINKANGKTYTTTTYHKEFINSKGATLFTPTDINSAGTKIASFPGGHIAAYPTNYFLPGSQLTWAAMMPISSTGTHKALVPSSNRQIPQQTAIYVINNLGKAGTCCWESFTVSATPAHTPFAQDKSPLDKVDPRGWMYSLVGAGANGAGAETRLDSARVSKLWSPTSLGINYHACLHSICTNVSETVVAPAHAVETVGNVLATSFATISSTDGTTPSSTKTSTTTSSSTTTPISTKPPNTTTPSSTKTTTTTPSATPLTTITSTTRSTTVTPTPSPSPVKSTVLTSSTEPATSQIPKVFNTSKTPLIIVVTTKNSKDELITSTRIVVSTPSPSPIESTASTPSAEPVTAQGTKVTDTTTPKPATTMATKNTQDALATPKQIVVSTPLSSAQMADLPIASDTPATALGTMVVQTDLTTIKSTANTPLSSDESKDLSISTSTALTSTTPTGTTSAGSTTIGATPGSTISSAKSKGSSKSSSSITQTQGEWKNMMQTTLPAMKASTSTMSFSGLAVERVMAPMYMISGQKLMMDTPITIGSMSPRTVVRLATSGSELVLAMSTEGSKPASATGSSTTPVEASQGQQSTTRTIGVGQLINQGLGGPTPGASATTSVKGVEYVTKSFGVSLRYPGDKMMSIRIELGLLSSALVLIALM